jgi:lipid-A-disaccharide synthase
VSGADLLVVAGEASGDRAAAAVVGALGGARVFGLGGPSLAGAGVSLVADLRDSTALGVGEVAARALSIGGALARVVTEARRRKPRAALLVNYTEFNAHLAHMLHDAGVRVLWYIAPQIWAWRASRARALRQSIDRMAVILPFEEELWRKEGIDAHYVGHPAMEDPGLGRLAAREALGLTPYAWAIAILPGSRPHEVKKLLRPMLEAYELVRRERASVDARVLLAPSLDADTRAWACAEARAKRVDTVDVDPARGAQAFLRAFDASLCASGTAALEAALARAVPIVTYKVGLLTELAARRFLRTEHIALPNVLLRRRAFPELVQRDLTVARLASTLGEVLETREDMLRACADVEKVLGPKRAPSAEVARMLRPWLGEA